MKRRISITAVFMGAMGAAFLFGRRQEIMVQQLTPIAVG